MKTFTYTITDPVGIHARPAGILAKQAKEYESTITIEYQGRKAELTRLMAVMALGIKTNAQVTITAEGEDEEQAIAEMEKCFREHL